MKSQTSLVATKIRLQQWAELIHECQCRPAGMKIDTWCEEHNISKANYYYRLRRVREACLEMTETTNRFVELPVPTSESPISNTMDSKMIAVLRASNGLSVEIYSGASPEIIQSLIGVLTYVK